MNLISTLTPINLLEEKEKFFADFTYNPQFMYEQEASEEQLTTYGFPTTKYLDLAKNILEKTFASKTQEALAIEEGKKLNQSEVNQKIDQFLRMHNLSERYEIVWSASFLSRTSITTSKIKLRLPVDFHHESLIGMIYHEIGTHALRRVNYEQQPWFKKKKKYEFQEYLETEEGLATLHSLLPYSNKSAHNSALRYLGVAKAQSASFSELWHFLSTYIPNPERRWIIAVRLKKGLTDTSKPGGFTKDLVYFKGLVDVVNWLKNNHYDLTPLYFGKLALEDAHKAVAMNPSFIPSLPSFFSLDPEKYAQDIEEIGSKNELIQI